jgi:hypothetical protein
MSQPKRTRRAQDDEKQLLIEFCLSKKKEFLAHFLKQRGLPFSGTREILRERLNEYLSNGELTIEELTYFLNRVEGWGNQHIYVYQAPGGSLSKWRTIAQAKKALAEVDLEDLLNAPKPLIMPEKPELSTVQLENDRLRFVWIERKIWYQRSEDDDQFPNDELVLRAYKINIERRITSFEIDLLEGNAHLALPNISKSAVEIDSTTGGGKKKKDHYQVLREQFESYLEPLIGISTYKRVRLSKAITKLEKSTEVKSREDGFETLQGGQILFTSPDVNSDTKLDSSMNSVKAAIPGDVKGTLGSYYWQPSPGGLTRVLFVKVTAPENSVAFRVQCTEDEVRYVLSRIRKLCK